MDQDLLTKLLMIVIILVIYVFIVQYCWNNTVSRITKTDSINLYQTFLLIVLIGTLLHTPLIISM